MKKVIHCSTAVFAIFSILIFSFQIYYMEALPDSFKIRRGESLQLANGITADVTESEKVSLNLLGVIPIKQVSVSEIDDYDVCLSGKIIGLKIFTKGVMVVGESPVETENGNVSPAEDAGIKIGDNIITIDGKSVSSNESVSQLIHNSNGKKMSVLISRKGVEQNVTLCPAMTKNGDYKAGLWVRDSSAGIGTMTFYDPISGEYAGLGHAICDVDTGEVLSVSNGEIVEANVVNIDRGVKGESGSLCGEFSGDRIGSLNTNNEKGIYGRLDSVPDGKTMKIALKQQIKIGKAQIYATIDGNTPCFYDCEIENLKYANSPTQNMVIHITDTRLTDKTGGIVQGMSGAPIVQNGSIIGAVTHVFVNDPTYGYAIFAENMYDEMKKDGK